MEEAPNNLDSSNAYFQGKVIAKLESIENLQHTQQVALSMKADSKMLDTHIEADRQAFERLNKNFDELSTRVTLIMGGIAVLSFLGEAALNHFWH